jgi:hypothetical protein
MLTPTKHGTFEGYTGVGDWQAYRVEGKHGQRVVGISMPADRFRRMDESARKNWLTSARARAASGRL